MALTLARLRRLTGDPARDSDGQLLTAYLDGSQAAFRELVERHAALVFGVCWRVLRHRQDAEDAFQAAFIVLARRAADVWPQDAVGAWLYGVASRVALKARAIRSRRQTREQPLVDVPGAAGPVPEDDLAAIIARAVHKLPEVYRAAIVACDLEGLSRRDAAVRLGWTEGTLSGRLARARRLLADRLRKCGIDFPAAGLAAVLGTNTTVHGRLIQTATELAFSPGGLPAPVATLTHGVTSSMFFLKLKIVSAVVLVTTALGWGAWTAGAGDDAGGPPTAKATQRPVANPTKPDTADLRQELKRLEQDIQVLQVLQYEMKQAGPETPESLKQKIQQAEKRLADLRLLLQAASEPPRPAAPPVKYELTLKLPLSPALAPLQGRWRIVQATAEGKSVPFLEATKGQIIEISGSTMTMPYLEGNAVIKRQEYKIAVDDSKVPHAIDLVRPNAPAAHGIYEFTAPATTCALCHKMPSLKEGVGLGLEGLKKDAIKLEGQERVLEGLRNQVQYLEALKGQVKDKEKLGTGNDQKQESNYQKLERMKGEKLKAIAEEEAAIEAGLRWLAKQGHGNHEAFSHDGQKKDDIGNLMGLCGPGLKWASGLRLAIADTGSRPTKFGIEKGVIELQLVRVLEQPKPPIALDGGGLKSKPADHVAAAEAALRHAQASAEMAMAQYQEAQARVALAEAEQARARLEVAKAQAALAEEAAKAAGPKPAKAAGQAGKGIAIYIRPRLAPEIAISLNPKEAKTVLEALGCASDMTPEEMSIKPGGVSVWVVRGNHALPVDLAAITLGGDSKSNYQLQPGDRLFVQTKVVEK